MVLNDECNAFIFYLLLFSFLILKVTAFAEQSYSYYSGNDGTDKDPQVVKSLCTSKLKYVL
jgi:hypothetical protein